MKKRVVIGIFSIIVALCCVAAVSGYYYLKLFSQKTIHINDNYELFTLKPGTSIKQLAKQMESDNIVDDAYLLPYLVRVEPAYQSIKAGTYQLSANMTIADFLTLLTSGKEVQFAIKLVEGQQAKAWQNTLLSAPYIVSTLGDLSQDNIAGLLDIDGSLEGWLYPDTYHYTENTTDLAILKRAHQKMKSTLQGIWDTRADNLPYQSPYEMLIMASIIEKETGVDREREKVASVFINRLMLKMKLQTDPTVIYGMGESYNGRLLSKDLRDKNNPYNTYQLAGLPPTPITMPSLASLQAAAHPETTAYLYFVADGYGGHVFSTNYRDHKIAVDKYWQLMREKKK